MRPGTLVLLLALLAAPTAAEKHGACEDLAWSDGGGKGCADYGPDACAGDAGATLNCCVCGGGSPKEGGPPKHHPGPEATQYGRYTV